MTIMNNHLIISLAVVFLVFLGLQIYFEARFFKFIKMYWFYKRSFLSRISSFLYLLGIGGLIFALLDLRGPEEKIKVQAPEIKTLILIDTSASMLAEDVKPSRLQKAILLAKHFARKAAGHQISVVVFAEIQKKLVPFTKDLDLIDSRLESLENLKNHYAPSGLSQALMESVSYFQENSASTGGNILVFTDGEETVEGLELKIPEEIKVALVGIGTEQGGRIPLDDGRGFRFGYKKDSGRDVITKLNEKFFKSTAADLSNAKYWIPTSYNLPTEEIIDFFKGMKQSEEKKQDMMVRPVLLEKILVPAIILLSLGYFLKFFKIFVMGLCIFVLPLHAQENQAPEISEDTQKKITELKSGKLSTLEKIKLADELYKGGLKPDAMNLYKEAMPSQSDTSIPPEAVLNYGSSLLETGQIQEGLKVYDELSQKLDKSERSDTIRKMMENNILSTFVAQEKKNQQDKQDKNNDKKDNKNDQSQSSSGSSSGSSQKKDMKNGSSEKKENDLKDQPKNEGEKKPEDQQNDPQQMKESQDKGKNQPSSMPPQKIPAKLKQLMSDDRQLQMKMIENGTKELNRKKSRKSKDW
jgi:Ca-activated chloride channel homolog